MLRFAGTGSNRQDRFSEDGATEFLAISRLRKKCNADGGEVTEEVGSGFPRRLTDISVQARDQFGISARENGNREHLGEPLSRRRTSRAASLDGRCLPDKL
jgi:hypothetical protein